MKNTDWLWWIGAFISCVVAFKYLRDFAKWFSALYKRWDSWFETTAKNSGEALTIAKEVRTESTIFGIPIRDAHHQLLNSHLMERASLRLSDTTMKIFWRVAVDGNLYADYVSQRFLDVTGLSLADCNRGGWARAVFDERDRDGVLQRFNACLKTGQEFTAHFALGHVFDTEQKMPVENRTIPVEGRDGVIIGFISGFFEKHKLIS